MNPTRTYYENGQIESESWVNEYNDKRHRLDGPACKEWYENGQLKYELWYINGEPHRLDGPAIQVWRSDGLVEWMMWWINGVKYDTEAEFQVAVDLYKANEIAGVF